jgi:3-oxoacyl-[acyl-carrier protein] reductase
VAVVTGGASGIGAAIAARVAAGAADHAEILDLTDAGAVQRAADATAAAMGRIDILVACAGITGPHAGTRDYPVADWQRVVHGSTSRRAGMTSRF